MGSEVVYFLRLASAPGTPCSTYQRCLVIDSVVWCVLPNQPCEFPIERVCVWTCVTAETNYSVICELAAHYSISKLQFAGSDKQRISSCFHDPFSPFLLRRGNMSASIKPKGVIWNDLQKLPPKKQNRLASKWVFTPGRKAGTEQHILDFKV